MLVGFFDKLNEDITWMNKRPSQSDTSDINQRVTAALFRILGRLMITTGIGDFIALPLFSSRIKVVGLACAVLLYIIGHDLFKMGDNLENHLSAYTSIGTVGKALLKGLVYGEEAVEESLAGDFTNHTILRYFWMEIFKAARKLS